VTRACKSAAIQTAL